MIYLMNYQTSSQMTIIPKPELRALLGGIPLLNHHLGWPTGGDLSVMLNKILRTGRHAENGERLSYLHLWQDENLHISEPLHNIFHQLGFPWYKMEFIY